jgi:hypothetical protein
VRRSRSAASRWLNETCSPAAAAVAKCNERTRLGRARPG